MIKLLIGGSPCTKWSIAQRKDREVTASGEGWELFLNYKIAKDKFQPDFFLYENNKSAAQAIKDQISIELGVPLMHINSALVSAQNRQRFYAFNWTVPQPEDRGIMLKDILETGCNAECDAVGVGYRNRREEDGKLRRRFESDGDEKANALTTVTTDSMVAEPINDMDGKAHCLTASYYKAAGSPFSGFMSEGARQRIAEQVGVLPREDGQCTDSKQYRVYGTDGKSVTICGNGGGLGAKTGLYALPVDEPKCYATPCEWDENGEPTKAVSCADGKTYQVYKVADGKITIKGKEYPIKLADGYHIIRKLSVTECCRLQTLPDDYCRAVSPSRAYTGLGGGWTAEVIIHILQGALKDVPKDEEILVLSMYDGIGTGRYCLDKMGFTNVKYYAYEIDPYAIKIAKSNFPDIIECGDAFDLRKEGWHLPER